MHAQSNNSGAIAVEILMYVQWFPTNDVWLYFAIGHSGQADMHVLSNIYQTGW